MKSTLLVFLIITLLIAACASGQEETELPETPILMPDPSSTPIDNTTTIFTETATKPPLPTGTPIPTATSILADTHIPTPTFKVVSGTSEILEPNGHAISEDYFLIDRDTEIFLTGPYFPYYIKFPKEGFKMTRELNIFNDGKSVGGMWENENLLLYLSVFIEPSTVCNDSINCRDYLWTSFQKRPDVENTDVEFSEYGEYAILERTHPHQISDDQIDQRHFNAELVRDNHWIDIHLSKLYFTIGEEKIFTDFLDHIEFVDRAPFLYGIAGGLYNEGAYENSLRTYNEAIAMGGLFSELPLTYQLRSEVNEKLGNYEAAINDLLYAIELDDSDPSLYNQVCWDYGLINKPELALPHCEKAVEMDPDPQYLDSRGLVYALLGNYDAAIADFQVVVDELKATTDPDLMAIYEKRLEWVEALKEGFNPITPEVLAKLREE